MIITYKIDRKTGIVTVEFEAGYVDTMTLPEFKLYMAELRKDLELTHPKQ